jgi:metal-responsive CopG/Arc/MetJ family transcriptional regulator
MVRIQLDLPEERITELDTLMKQTGIRTRKDLFNNALTLFEWAVKQRQLGRSIASVNESEGKFKEILMPSLENVRPAPDPAREEAVIEP